MNQGGRVYHEDFDDGPGGWLGWISNAAGAGRLEIVGGAVVSRSPWWVDYNHAPPGGGYLHLTMGLATRHGPNFKDAWRELAGQNRFIEGGYGRDFRHARVTVRLRGDLKLRGAQLLYHVQAKVGGVYVNHVLAGQPLQVTPDWSEQTLTLARDPAQWKCLGARHDRTDFYGEGPIEEVLRDLNGNMIFVLYPLTVEPAEPFAGGLHRRRAGEDYALQRERLPEGYVMYDYVRIEFPGAAS